MLRKLLKYRYWIGGVSFALSVAFYYCLPKQLFDDSYSTILNDDSGQLLSARIASDGQWRFPEGNLLSKKYEKALLTFEDKYFYSHPGVNPLALGRAMSQNVKAGHVVSGGSTISMQVIRLARQKGNRHIGQKLIEMIQAIRLELRYSKNEILRMYASHAPFGGNTVGIEAAAWRYFGRPSGALSWAEASLFAILPNQPSLLFPGRNTRLLKAKRDRLLKQLHESGDFDKLTLELAIAEPLPSKPQQLPMFAPHLLSQAIKEGHKNTTIQSTINRDLQLKVDQILKNHGSILAGNGVHNAAAVVLDIKNRNVLAYVGNIYNDEGKDHGEFVDVVRAPRSTGSLLKPFLYAAMLDEGLMLPNTLLPDVPSTYGQFSPQNFTKTYDGVVGAKMALARSLNMPAVHMLKQYGYPKFYTKLNDMGMSTLTQPPGHYGLTMILGGAEGSLWDMVNMYAGTARTLNRYHGRPKQNRYDSQDFRFSSYLADEKLNKKSDKANLKPNGVLSAASIWFAFEAMQEVYRPSEDASWQMFNSEEKIAWKTGTSFGHRDAWAVGVTSDYVVGVWAGNADGEGRPNLTGITAAAPIMFEVFDKLPSSEWFFPPMDELTYAAVDRESGYLASQYSNQIDTLLIPKEGLKTRISPYHRPVHLDASGMFRVDNSCEPINKMLHANWFVLPPIQAAYYKSKNPTYQELPPLRSDCYGMENSAVVMEMIYPLAQAELYIPKDINGEKGEIVFEVVHRSPESQLHWHLDDTYLGSTYNRHEISFQPLPGLHTITVVDNEGNKVSNPFKVLEPVTN